MVAIGQVVTGGGAPHSHPWSEVSGKPTTFPPSEHVHPWDTITGRPDVATLDARVDALEAAPDLEVTWGAVTGKPVAFPPTSHTHDVADVTGLAAVLAASEDRLDALEAAPAAPVLMRRWNGTAYVDAPDARIFVGEGDPGVMPEGSVWIGPDA